MANYDNILSKLNKDNVAAQRAECMWCTVKVAQFMGGLSDRNIVKINNKKDPDTGEQAEAIICNECLAIEVRVKEVKEGIRGSCSLDKNTGEIRRRFADMLVDYQGEPEEPKPATTTTTTKKSKSTPTV